MLQQYGIRETTAGLYPGNRRRVWRVRCPRAAVSLVLKKSCSIFRSRGVAQCHGAGARPTHSGRGCWFTVGAGGPHGGHTVA